MCLLDVQCPVQHHCNPVFSSFHVRNIQKKLEFIAQFTATMMYYVVVAKDDSRFNTWNTLFINIELIYIHGLQVPDDMCHETWEQSIYICCKKARLVYQPTAVVGAVLKSKQSNHTTSSVNYITEGDEIVNKGFR